MRRHVQGARLLISIASSIEALDQPFQLRRQLVKRVLHDERRVDQGRIDVREDGRRSTSLKTRRQVKEDRVAAHRRIDECARPDVGWPERVVNGEELALPANPTIERHAVRVDDVRLYVRRNRREQQPIDDGVFYKARAAALDVASKGWSWREAEVHCSLLEEEGRSGAGFEPALRS